MSALSELLDGTLQLVECASCAQIVAVCGDNRRCPHCGVELERMDVIGRVAISSSRLIGDVTRNAQCAFVHALNRLPLPMSPEAFQVAVSHALHRAAHMSGGDVAGIEVVGVSVSEVRARDFWNFDGRVFSRGPVPDDLPGELPTFVLRDEAGLSYGATAAGALLAGQRARVLGDA